jgi:DNA-binding transcriptional MerR regulator
MPKGLLTISELARRVGVSVRTLRYWSDEGLIPVASRSGAGYRLYDEAAVARLRLVGALRALDLSHEAIEAILRGKRTIADVATTHADALGAQLGVLRMQRAVLRAVARRCTTTEEMTMIHDLATATAAQRQRIVDDFVARVTDGLPTTGPSRGILENMRALPDALPDDPSDAHVDAWLELAALCGDASFVARVREMAEQGAAPPDPSLPALDHAAVMQHVDVAIDPRSRDADAVLDRIGLDGATKEQRAALRGKLETFTDVRVERYWELLGILSGRPPFPKTAPKYAWVIEALRARA